MKISDEQLSAFLDQELTGPEMDAIREAIRFDASLADRLALLASADAMLRRHASAIDATPMPEAVLQLLQPASAAEREEHAPAAADSNSSSNRADRSHSNKVVQLSHWQKLRRQSTRFVREHGALAAAVTLMIGFGAGFWSNGAPTPRGSAPQLAATTVSTEIAELLEQTLSGETVELANNTQLQSRFSFVDPQSRYCRQFVMEGADGVSENLACRDNNSWELMASVQTSRVYQGDYQPASGSSLLDNTLDILMTSPALSLEEEAELIASRWQD